MVQAPWRSWPREELIGHDVSDLPLKSGVSLQSTAKYGGAHGVIVPIFCRIV